MSGMSSSIMLQLKASSHRIEHFWVVMIIFRKRILGD